MSNSKLTVLVGSVFKVDDIREVRNGYHMCTFQIRGPAKDMVDGDGTITCRSPFYRLAAFSQDPGSLFLKTCGELKEKMEVAILASVEEVERGEKTFTNYTVREINAKNTSPEILAKLEAKCKPAEEAKGKLTKKTKRKAAKKTEDDGQV